MTHWTDKQKITVDRKVNNSGLQIKSGITTIKFFSHRAPRAKQECGSSCRHASSPAHYSHTLAFSNALKSSNHNKP